MPVRTARLATLALATAFFTAACGGKTDAPATTAGTDAAPTAAAGAQQISAELTGAGASFIYPLMARWSTDYNKATGAKINYQSIGSGGGIAQIKAATVDFGSSDKPLSSEELAQAGLAQFPSVIGGVVPVINVEGLQPGQLKLSGTVLADIFLHKITTWNDPAIVALNPGVTLPTGKINTVHRSDGSGTTFNFVNYLAKVSPEWKSKVGEGTSVNWPGGVGGKGNEGVAAYVRQLKGSIGYVELAYAEQNNMSYASLQNAAGQFVKPTPESFAAAAASADWANAKDFNLVITNAPGEQAWPITATNFILVYKQPKDATKAKHTLAFFKWAYEQGQAQANELDYVPLPPELVGQIEQYWNTEIKL
ncbi:MAG: phosphate ABC transporter substrate-binding protein PstS [Pseudoxanthomonas sp.]|uniref:phosphate ABC transporter substrate-binding protein PstS n=1 Tax=Pseudoxanthomonas sp. TaxID=1871049 RepID=UPI0028C39264|nr:phosphate ABC transporter substrate-binding protein PstS [Pseudoxanthomonas sp.]MCR6626863.1 phosphate ABC transporter substrate-binding protein PstS [Pseudoxanthomonas sp.]